jgi:hypothetical protein
MPTNVIFSNKSSKLNKKLIKFFQVNLLSLNKVSLVFEFEVAHPNEIDAYVKRGIKNYPVLLDGKTSVTGVEKIINYLKIMVKRHNTKILSKTDDDQLDEYWRNTIGKIEVDEAGNVKPLDDDDDDEDLNGGGGDNLHHRIQEAFEQRNSDMSEPSSFKNTRNKPNKSNISRRNDESEDKPSKTMKEMKTGSGRGGSEADKDDELMAKFFENQEES